MSEPIPGLFIDKDGYPVNETGDGMDSAVREGILQVCEPPEWAKVKDIDNFEIPGTGLLTRHPLQSPADNEWNCTWDQTVCLIAGLYARGKTAIIRRVFWKIVKRGFFTQNFDRDVRGSVKRMRPHCFYKDSHPTNETQLMTWSWKRWQWEVTLPDQEPDIEVEYKYFDWADPVWAPDRIAFLIKATKYYWLYPLMIPGLIWLLISFAIKRQSSQANNELNQLFCQCSVLGKFWEKQITTLPDWKTSFTNYWVGRNEGFYSDLIYSRLKKLA